MPLGCDGIFAVVLLSSINQPSDLRALSYEQLAELAGEIRDLIVRSVADNAGHLGSNLGAVEITLALHRVFESPNDAILWNAQPIAMSQLRGLLEATQTMDPIPELHLQPDPAARYDTVDRVLAVTKVAKISKMGFIGNEAYRAF